MTFQEFLPVLIPALLISLGPFLAYFLYLNQRTKNLWKPFLFGWGGWLLALFARIIPVQVPGLFITQLLQDNFIILLAYVAYASLLAGVFEEGFRYVLLDQRKHLRKSKETLLAFGIGWGLGEAVLTYATSMIALPFIIESLDIGALPTLLEILPGAVERNIAIIAHISLTFIVLKSVQSKKTDRKKFLALAMFLHFLLNIVAVYSLYLSQNAWISELSAATFSGFILLIAYKLTKK